MPLAEASHLPGSLWSLAQPSLALTVGVAGLGSRAGLPPWLLADGWKLKRVRESPGPVCSPFLGAALSSGWDQRALTIGLHHLMDGCQWGPGSGFQPPGRHCAVTAPGRACDPELAPASCLLLE